MKFIKNAIWTFSGTIGVQVLGLIINIILARLLSPEIFGVVNLALVIIVFLQIVQEAGLSSILIQKKELTKSLIATTFYLNITFSLVLCVITFLIAGDLALFFDHAEIEELLHYSIIGIFIGSLGVTNRGIMVRNRQFKTLSIINLASELLGIVLTFVFLYYGNYLLAIGIRIIARPAFQAIFMISLYGLKGMSGKPEFRLLKEIMPFSSSLLGISTLNYLKNNIDSLFIGKVIGSGSLGIYTLAFQWSTIAKFYISGSVAKVLLPEISKNQHDIDKVRQIFVKVIKQISFVIFPFCVGLLLLAPEFIIVVYGRQWEAAIPILRILVIAGLIASFGTIIGKLFEGLGKPGEELKITTASIIVFLPLLYIGSFFGLIGVAFAVLLHTVIFDSVLLFKAMRLLNMPFIDFFTSLKPAAYSTLLVALLYSAIKNLLFPISDNVTVFIILFLLQTILYCSVSFVFNKSIMLSFLEITSKMMNVKRKNSMK